MHFTVKDVNSAIAKTFELFFVVIKNSQIIPCLKLGFLNSRTVNIKHDDDQHHLLMCSAFINIRYGISLGP